MKPIDFLLKTTTKQFDTRKVLNRSSKPIPGEIIENLEDGIFTTEMIDQLAGQFPVYRYQTCITIHGAWESINTRRIGGYANVIQNKNGSVEVRYSAIDTQKVSKINNLIRSTGKRYQINTTSSDRSLMFSKSITKDNYEGTLDAYRQIAERVGKVNFYGTVQIYTAQAWGITYLVLEISPLAIPETSVNDFVLAVLGVSQAEFDQMVEAENLENQKRDQEAAKAAQAREQKNQRVREAVAVLEAQISNLRECSDPTKGIIVKATNTPEGKPIFVFYKATKGSFGRIKIEKATSTELSGQLNWSEFKQMKPAEFLPFGKICRLYQVTD